MFLFLTKNADMGVIEGFGMSIIGMILVFIVLIALMFVIVLLSKMVKIFESWGKTPQAPATAAPAASAAPEPSAAAANKAAVDPSGMVEAPGSVGEVALHNVDDQTAAMLMAIVADELKTPLNQLRFISIKEV